MKRKTLYYSVNLIVPTGLMGILICIVFCLPTAAGEKMTLCMSILLALNLFQLLVTKILPPTSAVVPLIAKYLLFTFSLNVLVIGKLIIIINILFLKFSFQVNTVIITNFYYRTPMTHTMPNWLRRVFLHILPRLLWMESPKLRQKREEYELFLTMNTVHSPMILQNPLQIFNDKVINRHKNRLNHIEKVKTKNNSKYSYFYLSLFRKGS